MPPYSPHYFFVYDTVMVMVWDEHKDSVRVRVRNTRNKSTQIAQTSAKADPLHAGFRMTSEVEWTYPCRKLH